MSRDVHMTTNQNDNQRASYSLLLLEGSQKSFHRERLRSDCFFSEGVRCFETRPLPRDHRRQTVCLICGTPLCHQRSSSHTNGCFTRSCLSQLLLALLSAIIQVLMSSRFSSGSQSFVLRSNALMPGGFAEHLFAMSCKRRGAAAAAVFPLWRGETRGTPLKSCSIFPSRSLFN